MRRPHSIRAQMMVALLGITIAELVVVSGAVLSLETWLTRRSLQTDVGSLSSVMAQNLEAPLLFADAFAARETLGTLDTVGHVRQAVLVGPEGEVVAALVRDMDGHLRPVDSIQTTIARDTLFETSERIHTHGRHLGTLSIVADHGPVRARTERFGAVLLAIFVGTLVLAVLVAVRLQAWVARPIEELADTARRITDEQDYSLRATDEEAEELAALVRGFNSMMGRIEQRDAALNESRDNLEQRVDERTAELTKAKNEAEEAFRAKSEFLANISHELRTPMHAILAFADLGVQKGVAKPEKARGYFEHILDSGQRLLGLLNELLDLSKLEAGKMRFEFTTVDLGLVVQNAVDESRSLFDSRGMKLELDVQEEIVLNVDRNRILQVVHNVIHNAVKFSPEGGRVWVTVDRAGDSARIRVRDEGVGIPEQDLERIFHTFEQSSVTKTGAGGTGLGLAICEQIVQVHRGDISAANHRDGGAVFTIRIPIESPANLAPRDEEPGIVVQQEVRS